MKTLILATILSLSCPKTIMINKTKYPWNDHDKEIFNTCTYRCGQIYPDAPCLKLFEKVEKQDYHCICGK